MEDFFQTIKNLGFFFINGIGSLIILIIMLCIVMFFLDEKKIVDIIKKIKPRIVDIILEPANQFINNILNLFINKKCIEIDKESNFNNDINFYLEENEKIDKNIFVLSLSEGIVKMLNFIGDDYLYESAMNYLINYLHELQMLKQDKNFYTNIMDEYQKLERGYSSIIRVAEDKELGDSSNNAIFEIMKKETNNYYFNYLINEKEKLIELKNENNNKIVFLIQKELHEREFN